MTKAIIGTISGVDTPLTPQMKGELADNCYLRGISYLDRQQMRMEILTASQRDIKALAPLVRDCMKENVLCVFGGEQKLKDNRKLFGSVAPAL